MQKYRKKPDTIEAVRYNGKNAHKIRLWTNDKAIESPVLEPTINNPTGQYLQITIGKHVIIAIVGDWVIKSFRESTGYINVYTMNPILFEATYEKVED